MKNILTICLTVALLCCGACRTTETEIVYARTTQADDATNGFMRVATEDEVPVTIDGHPKAFQRRSISGFMVISEEDLIRLIQNTKKLRDLTRKK